MDGFSTLDPEKSSSSSGPSNSDTNSDIKEYKGKTSKWRNSFIIIFAAVVSCGIILAIVIPVCINNDCSGQGDKPDLPTDKPSSTDPDSSTTRTTFTTTTRRPVTTTTVQPPTPSTSQPPTDRPTLIPRPTTPPPTQTPSPGEYIERDPRAETDSGPIIGHVVEVDVPGSSNFQEGVTPGIVSWVGIPFAKPPVGDLRWRKPQPMEPWTEPLIANKQTPLCVQGGGTVRITHPHWPDEMFQEDCLYMHIVAPRNAARDYPVMFWIYGGSFNSGGNVQYPGHFLAMQDVVVVTTNYRLNIMGFASTESGEARGNFGLWDQLEALKWVHKNIHAFGGNPNNITLFGESAGGASVGLLLASPEAKGYFSQAILQSGNEYSVWAVNGDEVHPHSYIVQVAEQWNCTYETSGGTVTDDDEMMECLRQHPPQALRRTNFDCPFCLDFSPVVDGEGGILPKMPLDLRLERLSSEVPIMSGTTSDECTIGMIAADPSLILRGVNRTEYNWLVDEVVDHFQFAITEEDRKTSVRQAFDFWYTPWPFYDNGNDNKVALANMCLDFGFVASTVDQLRHHSRFAKSYKYVYSYQISPTIPPIGWLPDWIGVPHALELPFVFGLPFMDDNPAVAEDAGNFDLDVGVPVRFSQSDKDWATYTMTLWTNFAKYGNPTPEPVSPPGLPPVIWEDFSEVHHNYFLIHPDGTSTKEDYRSQDVTFAHNYANGIGRGADMHNPFGFPPFDPSGMRVETKYGPVIGHPISTGGPNSVTIGSYLGIPFAKPPVGRLRWKKPEEPEPWTQPFIADTIKPQCPQSVAPTQVTHPGWDQFSEDCLYLNLYAPVERKNEPYPVMVYVYGGGYQFGGTLQYPGHFLAAKDVIVVVLTYRLNVLGFLSTDEPNLHSNFGLWDQLRGLRWVNENIQKFGGDPNKVTIFGQSAGAASVGLMMVSPLTQGLFHQVIFQSGTDLGGWAVNSAEVKPETFVQGVAEQVGCGDEAAIGNEEMLDCMREVPAEDLLAANVDCEWCLGFGPVVDGVDGYLPKMPRELRLEGNFHHVPIMTGTTTEDCNILLLGVDPTLALRGVDREEFEQFFHIAIETLDFLITTEGREDDMFNALNWMYSPWPLNDNGEENKIALAQACTDVGFVAPEHELVEYLVHRNITVYQYQFGMTLHGRVEIPSPGPIPVPIPVPIPDWIGSTHMFDLPFVWGYPQIIEAPQELQDDTGNLAIPVVRYDELDLKWSDYIITLWTNFAKYGNPTPNGESPPNSPEHLTWKKTTADERNYFFMSNDLTEPRVNLRSEAASFWNNYMLSYMARGGPTHFPWQWHGESRFPLPSQNGEKKESEPKGGHAKNFFNVDTLIKMLQEVAIEVDQNDPATSNKVSSVKTDESMRRQLNNPMHHFSKEVDVEALKRVLHRYAAEHFPELQ